MARYVVPVFTPSGQVTDAQHRPLATVEYVDSLVPGVDTSVDYSDLPAFMTLVVKKVGSVWPGPPTLRSDIIIIWKGAEPSPPIVSARTLGTPGMLDNVDLRMIT